MNNEVHCPKCGSTQISANNRGWSLMTGFIGSGKIIITCLSCGKQFRPGQQNRPTVSTVMFSPGATKGFLKGGRIILLLIAYFLWFTTLISSINAYLLKDKEQSKYLIWILLVLSILTFCFFYVADRIKYNSLNAEESSNKNKIFLKVFSKRKLFALGGLGILVLGGIIHALLFT